VISRIRIRRKPGADCLLVGFVAGLGEAAERASKYKEEQLWPHWRLL
jgi:hypothetical protein